MKPFRFGIVAAQAASGEEWKDLARRVEQSGYASLLMPDGAGPILSPFSALATAAAVTSKLRVGNWVLANDLRNPVLLAREAATLDLLSDGRFELGLGAGRGDTDYSALGMGEVPSPGVRLSRLDESLQLLQQLFTGEPVTFNGEHYSVTNATIFPVPKAKRIPVLLAAAGPRALSLAGKRADIVAIAGGSADMYRQQVERLRSAAGSRFENIELASIVWLAPDDNPAARQTTEMMVKRLAGVDLDTLIASKTPTVLVGSRAAMIEQLQAARETLGLSYVIVNGQAAPWFAPVVERLAGS